VSSKSKQPVSTVSLLPAAIRTGRGKGPARQVRMRGGVPAEVYGLGEPNQSVVVDAHDLGLLLARGMNTLITLSIDGSEQLTLCRQVHRHPVKGSLQHVDFVRVRADQEIDAEVAVSLVGEPAGVSDGGMLEQLVFSVTVTAKPNAIPQSIEHDVSALALGDHLRAGELVAPPGAVIKNDPDELLAVISIPRALAAEEGEAAEGEAAEGEAGEGEAAEGASGGAADRAGDAGE
jgi:large subunit ribosomal protein L25